MKVLKKFEFNNGANCIVLFLRNNGYTVSLCEEHEDGWWIVRDYIICAMNFYEKALHVFRSFEQFVKEGNSCEEFRVSNLN